MKKLKVYYSFFVITTVCLTVLLIQINNINVSKIHNKTLKPKIMLFAHVYQNPYWKYIKKGAEDAAKERGVIIEYDGPKAASVKTGIKLIDKAISSNVDGIITYVQDEKEYIPYINKAVDNKIPLVTVDADALHSKCIAYVGTDNIKAGSIAAKEIIKNVGKKGNIAIIVGGDKVKNQIERVEGFLKYINCNSNLKVKTIKSSNSYALEAELAVKKILKFDNKIDAFYCTSALDGVGTAKAVISANMAGKVVVVCFDDLPDTVENIRKGVVNATIVQRPYEMGYKAVNIIADNLDNKGKRKTILTDVEVLNKKNINDYVRYEGENCNEKR